MIYRLEDFPSRTKSISLEVTISSFNNGFSFYNCYYSLLPDATAISLAPFGQGTGPIWLDNLACLGFEDSLFNCTYDAHTADCAHFEDAGLRCQRKSNPYGRK